MIDEHYRGPILLAIPDPERRSAYAEALRKGGYDVLAVADAAAALMEAGRAGVALVFVRLPDAMSGVRFCREIRAASETRDTLVLVLMPSDDAFGREQVVRAGATAILIEPLREALLLRRVRRLMTRYAHQTGVLRHVRRSRSAAASTGVARE